VIKLARYTSPLFAIQSRLINADELIFRKELLTRHKIAAQLTVTPETGKHDREENQAQAAWAKDFRINRLVRYRLNRPRC